MELPPFADDWDADDPHANFKEEVALWTRQDPMPMMRNLSAATGIAVESLIRFALVRWGSEGTELAMHAEPRMVRKMWAICEEAERADTDQARLDAYAALRDIISWLRVPLT